jgi:hypothetical protein
MTAFWNIALCSLVEVDRRFKGAYCLHHQDDNGAISQNAVIFIIYFKFPREYKRGTPSISSGVWSSAVWPCSALRAPLFISAISASERLSFSPAYRHEKHKRASRGNVHSCKFLSFPPLNVESPIIPPPHIWLQRFKLTRMVFPRFIAGVCLSS